jgi:ATP-dependent exoDNAse (exonuclease V) beta subunit
VDANFGLRQEEILSDAPGTAAAGAERYREWLERREHSVGQGAQPKFDLLVASESAAAPADFDCAVALESVPRGSGRPSGRRFGTLVHAVLRDAELGANEAAIASLAGVHARLLGAPTEEVDAAMESAVAALAHPLLQRAQAAERCHRELPVLLRLEDGRMLEGVIDLAFLEQGTWHIVDFKTDVDLPAGRPQYERQLRWYALALWRISGRPVRAWLLSI